MRTKKTNSKEYLLAVKYFKEGDFNKTIEICKKNIAVKKNTEDDHYLLAVTLKILNNHIDAFLEIDKAIKLNRNKIEYFIFKGNLNREIMNSEKALQSFQLALKIDSKNTDALYWTSVTMYEMGQKKSALKIINNAISIKKDIKYMLFKAKCLEALNEYKEALIEYNSILEINNREFKTLIQKSDLLRRMFKYDLALEYVTKAMEIDKINMDCYLLKSTIFKDIKKFDEALKLLDEGLSINPKSVEANFNKSIMLLQCGKLKKGWALYEWRWKLAGWSSKQLATSKPFWCGQKDVILYIWAEQGIGDEVMFASIFNDVEKDVAKLIVKTDLRLIKIYQRSFPNIKFISSNEEINEHEYEYHLPIGSLPKFYRNQLNDFEDKNNFYLKTNKEFDCILIDKYKNYINKRKIGVSWKSKNPLSGLKRSLELEDILKYADDNEAVYVNLQYGDVVEEIEAVQKKGFNIINISEIDNMKNIDGLLSVINICDEVISIDNSTVHFAGAIGKKTEVLMHESADFRWEIQGNTTKWYKSLTLKRNIIL